LIGVSDLHFGLLASLDENNAVHWAGFSNTPSRMAKLAASNPDVVDVGGLPTEPAQFVATRTAVFLTRPASRHASIDHTVSRENLL